MMGEIIAIRNHLPISYFIRNAVGEASVSKPKVILVYYLLVK
jgi:hypothetical protein